MEKREVWLVVYGTDWPLRESGDVRSKRDVERGVMRRNCTVERGSESFRDVERRQPNQRGGTKTDLGNGSGWYE